MVHTTMFSYRKCRNFRGSLIFVSAVAREIYQFTQYRASSGQMQILLNKPNSRNNNNTMFTVPGKVHKDKNEKQAAKMGNQSNWENSQTGKTVKLGKQSNWANSQTGQTVKLGKQSNHYTNTGIRVNR